MGSVGGGAGSTALSEFSDDNFAWYDNLDPTKIVNMQLSGLTTGTTRTYTAPDADGTLALTSDLHDAVTLSGTGAYISLTGQDIQVDPIDTIDISDDAVTYAKIQNMTEARILGRIGAGTGIVEELSTLPSVVQSNISAV